MGGLLSHDNKRNTYEVFSTLTTTVITVGFFIHIIFNPPINTLTHIPTGIPGISA